jgi:ATP-dependent DNA helicase 2 subunit 2
LAIYAIYSSVSSPAIPTKETVSFLNDPRKTILTIPVLSALALAVYMIGNATKGAKGNHLKYDRRIIIVTDGRGNMDTDDLEQMSLKIKDPDAPIEIVLLGVDFDDADSGYKEEDKPSHKVQ